MPFIGCPTIPHWRVRVLRCICAALAVVLPMLMAGAAWGDVHGPAVVADEAQLTETEVLALSTMEITGGLPEPQIEPEPAGYADQYLFEGEVAVYEDGGTIDNEPFGQRLFATELVYYRSDDDLLGDEMERGARALWRRETLHWGVVDAEIQFSNIDSDFLGRDGNGTDLLFTLRQSAMAVERATSSSFAASSRVRPPKKRSSTNRAWRVLRRASSSSASSRARRSG